MKLHITPSTLASTVESALSVAVAHGANCARILPAGRTRASILNLEKVPSFLGHEAEVTFGRRIAIGLDFHPLSDTPSSPQEATSPQVSPPAEVSTPPEMSVTVPAADLTASVEVFPPGLNPEWVLPKRVSRVITPQEVALNVSRGTGYMAYMDELLHTFDSPVKMAKGFRRSKFTVDEVVQRVLVRFPNKNPASVKRVAKVRPRHLEKVKTSERYDNEHKAPRWRITGAGKGTGYMHRIDELLSPKLKKDWRTTRQVAEIVCREFGKDMELALKVVRVRISHYEKKWGVAAKFIRQAPKSSPVSLKRKRAALLKARNLALLKRKQRRK